MNDISELNNAVTNDELDDAQLEAIYGGMNCDVARGFARTFRIVAQTLLAQDLSSSGGDYWHAVADGYENSCG